MTEMTHRRGRGVAAAARPQRTDLPTPPGTSPTDAERDAYLDAACGGDADRRSPTSRRCCRPPTSRPAASSDRPRRARPPATVDHARPETSGAGTVIGRQYKLLEQIGEGGMGTRLHGRADRTRSSGRSRSSSSRPGMDSKQVLARFEAERQALALMDHPNIARVFDAGAHRRRPAVFVMELVKGVPITEYCDEHQLTPAAAAGAVRRRSARRSSTPTRRAIIHRDIKPSNVLVALYDGKPVPKVIDFGVAKATGQRLTEQTLFTGFGAMVGTPEYMCPEQAELNDLDIDTRTDVYALGVLLYELLTGSTPFDRSESGEGGAAGDAADDPGGGAAAAEHPAERPARGACRRSPANRGTGAGEADEAGARRAGLDRDEGAWRRTAPAATRRPTASRRTCSGT